MKHYEPSKELLKAVLPEYKDLQEVTYREWLEYCDNEYFTLMLVDKSLKYLRDKEHPVAIGDTEDNLLEIVDKAFKEL